MSSHLRAMWRGATRKTAVSGVWFHASPVKMEPGTALKAAETIRYRDQIAGKVYFTPDPWIAINHLATNFGGGITSLMDERHFIYQVEPIGDIEDDPEAMGYSYFGMSYMADDAVVLKRYDFDSLGEVLDFPHPDYHQGWTPGMETAAALTKTASRTLYHLTDKADFRLDPRKSPSNNTTMGEELKPGIFLAPSAESWANGYGYWRPWVVEFSVPDGVGMERGYGGEVFVLAEDYDKISITRVMALDAYGREKFQDWGWTETEFGTEFDTEQPLPPGNWHMTPFDRFPYAGYRAQDIRSSDPSWRARYQARVKKYQRGHGGVYASRTASISGIQSESPTPLDYRGKFWGPSTRYYLTDPGAPEVPKNDNYFTDRPKTGFVPPTDPDTVAWIDVFEDNGPGRQWVYIAFMAVRTDYRGQGLGSRLIAHLYATYPDARIEWGTLIGDRTPVLYKRYKQTHPAQTGGGSAW